MNGTQIYPEAASLHEAYQGVAPLAVLGNSINVYDAETSPQLSHSDISRDPKR